MVLQNATEGTYLPDDRRYVEEERLDEQHDRHPLVVAEVLLDGALLAGDHPLRQVVRVRDPADLSYCTHGRQVR